MIEELRAKLPKRTPNPQCCCTVDPPSHNQMWRKDRFKRLRPAFDPDKCQRTSDILIDGKPYCRVHAGIVAIDRWLSGQLVDKQP